VNSSQNNIWMSLDSLQTQQTHFLNVDRFSTFKSQFIHWYVDWFVLYFDWLTHALQWWILMILICLFACLFVAKCLEPNILLVIFMLLFLIWEKRMYFILFVQHNHILFFHSHSLFHTHAYTHFIPIKALIHNKQ
jgi:hypothetical protein